MRGMSYTKATRATDTAVPSNSYVQEALAKHAASRPPKGKPNIMPVTPTLPRVPKPKGRRRRTV
jgi:hypothetical protein